MSVPCPTGQTCLQGLCFTTCDSTHTCGPRESCSSGVCVARTGDAGPIPHDAGVDGGPCAAVHCTSPLMCNAGQCVQCLSSSDCGGAMPICDIGRGNCVTFSPQYCAPCNTDGDCSGTPTASHCIMRSAPDATEHVCLPAVSATGGCPAGFMASGTNCVPIYFSCTALRAAQQHRACTMDSDCPQLGATPSTGLFAGMCSVDAASGARVCHYTCGIPTDCPSGLSCDVAAGFCM